jgi:NTE family protein
MKESMHKWANLSSLLDLSIRSPGLLRGKKFKKELFEIFDKKNMSEVKIDIFLNSADIISKNEYIFTNNGIVEKNSGKLFYSDVLISDAVYSSCAIPLVFEPNRIGNFVFVDGGLLNHLAYDLIVPSDFDLVILIDTTMANTDFIGDSEVSKFNVIPQCISTMQAKNHFSGLAALQKKHSNVLLITPKTGTVSITRREWKRLIKCGYDAAKEVFSKYKSNPKKK